MDVSSRFTQALGVQPPWQVTRLEFKAAEKRLDVCLDFPRGSEFPCPECSVPCKVHDAEEHEWRHLNFFEHLTFLKAMIIELARSGLTATAIGRMMGEHQRHGPRRARRQHHRGALG